jgi:plastocyanin
MHSVVGRRLRLAAVQACLSLAILALMAFALMSKSASAAGVSVEAGDYYFCSPAFHYAVCETDITVGDTVTWNVLAGRHTVTECTSSFATCPPTGGFDSGFLVTLQTVSQTFDTPGTYSYHCQLHKNEMKGTIVVSAATPAPTPAPTLEQATATEAPTPESPTPSPSAAALPKMGGTSPGSGTNTPQYVLLALGMALLGGAGLAFAIARKR